MSIPLNDFHNFLKEHEKASVGMIIMSVSHDGLVSFNINANLANTAFMKAALEMHVTECLAGRDPMKQKVNLKPVK